MAVPTWIRQTLNRFLTKKRQFRNADRRGVKLQLEVLEDRVVPATIYVGSISQFSSVVPGPTTWTPGANFAGFTPQAAIFGTNAFTNLQTALNAASTGDTIDVAPGVYTGNYNINTGVTLQGANAAASAAALEANFVASPAETTVISSPASPGGVYNDIFRVGANNVSISGFVLEGSGVGDDGITNFNAGTGNTMQVSGVSIQQNIIQDFTGSGIYLDNAGATQGAPDPSAVSTGNTIQTNYVANNGNAEANYDEPGIGLFDNFFATVANNTVVVPADTTTFHIVEGITVSGFSTNAPASSTISGNTITVGQGSAGVFVNIIGSSATINVTGNTIQAASGVVETAAGNTWAESIKSISASGHVIESGDTIGTTGGQFAHGIDAWGNGPANVTLAPTQIGGGAALSPVIGINLNNNDPFYGLSTQPNSVPVNGGTITGASIGVQAAGVLGFTLSNVTISAPTAISGTGLLGNAVFTGVNESGSGSSSLAFTGPGTSLTVSALDGFASNHTNIIVINGVNHTLQYNSDETINYSGLGALTVDGDDGAPGAPDGFAVTPDPIGSTIITVNGNVNPVATLDTLVLVLTGLVNPHIHGTLSFGNLTSPSFTVNNPAVFWNGMAASAAVAPTITSANHYTVVNGIDNPNPPGGGTFHVTATPSLPPAVFSVPPGSLPSGTTLSPSGALVVGPNTPAGTYTFTITASNGVLPDATQNFTLTVDQYPSIVTAPNETVVVGIGGSFNVSIPSGNPQPLLTYTSTPALPNGFVLNAATGLFSWSSTAFANNAVGVYHVTFIATNILPGGIQGVAQAPVTLTVTPVIISANSATIAAGTGGTFAVTAAPAALALPGTNTFTTVPPSLPAGITLSPSGTLSVAPTVPAGTYTFTITFMNNGSQVGASQIFTLNVTSTATAPVFGPPPTNTEAVLGTAGSFQVTAAGTPAPSYSIGGAGLPNGFSFNPATGTLSWSAFLTNSSVGLYNLVFTATNSHGSATQNVTLGVEKSFAGAPGIASLNHATIGQVGGTAITVIGTGIPTPALGSTALPGFVHLNTSTGALTVDPNSPAGTYYFSLTASNSLGGYSQPFTLTVTNPQLLAGAANTNPKAQPLTQAQLAPIVSAAIQNWINAGINPFQAALLKSTSISIGDLTATGELGDTANGRIVIDATADGDGWYINASNQDFTAVKGSKQMVAKTGPAATEVDLLTVVMHEMGHILGLPDLDPTLYPNQLMTETLSVGVRRMP